MVRTVLLEKTLWTSPLGESRLCNPDQYKRQRSTPLFGKTQKSKQASEGVSVFRFQIEDREGLEVSLALKAPFPVSASANSQATAAKEICSFSSLVEGKGEKRRSSELTQWWG